MQKIIIRTLFYHWLFLFTGLIIGFAINAEWIGYKSLLIEKSLNKIFFPIEFTPKLESKIKQKAIQQILIDLNYPKDFEVLSDVIYYNDEFYWCRYKFRDEQGSLKFKDATTRVVWKTWEYYYGDGSEIVDSLQKEKDLLNSINLWHYKIKQAIKKADDQEKTLIDKENKKYLYDTIMP